MNRLVKKNKYGFYELINKPTSNELSKYYEEKYYQESRSNYEQNYTAEEIKYFHNKIEQKYEIVMKNLCYRDYNKARFLDIGCGEGWALKYFKSKGWDVTGLDYSNYGCEKHNAECLGNLITGDVYVNIESLRGKQNLFDCIWLGNILEHVLDPLLLLNDCHDLISKDGILIVEVPNDFSAVQQYLLKNDYIQSSFWIMAPDHISYFNADGLKLLCDAAGWDFRDLMTDFPIDLDLLNANTNYVVNPQVGKSCHTSRVTIENFLHDISVEKVNKLYQAFADLGVGRSIVGFFKKRDK